MKYHLTENLSGRKGTISNLHCFLNRYLDTGFKTKWTGLWAPPTKYLDYYAFKINGIWLDETTVQGIEYGEQLVYYHETGSLSVKEIIETPEDLSGIEVTLEITNKTEGKIAAHTVLEMGVDIRNKYVDVNNSDYKFNRDGTQLSFSRNGKTLVFSSDNEFEIPEDSSYVKEHYPGGERQKCFIPGDICFKNELEGSTTLKMSFTTSDAAFGKIEENNQEFLHPELTRLYNYSTDNVENLIYDQNNIGILAGHPWFQSYWARDSFWSALGLIDAGYFKLTEDLLLNFAQYDNIPDKINLDTENRVSEFSVSDSEPLFILAVEKLKRHYKENQELTEKAEKILDNLETNKDGLVKHSPDGTWMDTLKREQAIDIQSLWLEAAKRMKHEKKNELKKGLTKFEQEKYPKDCLGEGNSKTINPAVPLMFKQFEEETANDYLQVMNAEFSSLYGARTRSMADPGYEASGYHTGSSWGLTTCWAAAANMAYGKNKQGVNFLGKLNQFLDGNQVGGLPEVVDSETGELMGCSEQAWTAALVLNVVDTYLLGIRVKNNEKVVISPEKDVTCERKGKKVGNERLDLTFDNGKVEVLNDPDLDIIIEEK